ncbi:hypothetical protein MMC08_005045 [Hypocenomyce scalaris]|nr:hypothetical protein [Hypocenomyce scalaris]
MDRTVLCVTTTGDVTNALAGNIASWAGSAVVVVVLSLVFPQDLRRFIKTMSLGDKTDIAAENVNRGARSAPEPETVAPTGNDVVDYLGTREIEFMEPVVVKKGERLAPFFNGMFLIIAILLVPFTLFGTKYVYSKSFFTGWTVVNFIWVWTSMVICIIYPSVESRRTLRDMVSGIGRDEGSLLRMKEKEKKNRASSEREV